MVEVGKLNTMEVSRSSDFGLLFDGGEPLRVCISTRDVQ